MFRITILHLGEPEHAVDLRDRTLRIGRGAGNEIMLRDPDKTTSRVHAEVRREGSQWVFIDNDSQNGCWIEGRRVDRVVLRPGVMISFGDYELVCEEIAAPSQDEAARHAPEAPPADESSDETQGAISQPDDPTPLRPRPLGPEDVTQAAPPVADLLAASQPPPSRPPTGGTAPPVQASHAMEAPEDAATIVVPSLMSPSAGATGGDEPDDDARTVVVGPSGAGVAFPPTQTPDPGALPTVMVPIGPQASEMASADDATIVVPTQSPGPDGPVPDRPAEPVRPPASPAQVAASPETPEQPADVPTVLLPGRPPSGQFFAPPRPKTGESAPPPAVATPVPEPHPVEVSSTRKTDPSMPLPPPPVGAAPEPPAPPVPAPPATKVVSATPPPPPLARPVTQAQAPAVGPPASPSRVAAPPPAPPPASASHAPTPTRATVAAPGVPTPVRKSGFNTAVLLWVVGWLIVFGAIGAAIWMFTRGREAATPADVAAPPSAAPEPTPAVEQPPAAQAPEGAAADTTAGTTAGTTGQVDVPGEPAQPAEQSAPVPAQQAGVAEAPTAAPEAPARVAPPATTAPTEGAASATPRPPRRSAAERARREDLDRQYNAGREALAAGRAVEARDLLAAVAAASPGYRGVDELLRDAESAVRREASTALEAADRHVQAGDFDQAEASLQRAERLGAPAGEVASARARLRAAMTKAGEKAFADARQFDGLGRNADAIRLYQAAVRLLPETDPRRAQARQRLDALGARRP